MDRAEWIKSLKKGSLVAYRSYTIYSRNKFLWRITKVKTVTPTGRIRLDTGELLDHNGVYESSGYSSTQVRIEPITKEILDSIDYTKKLSNELSILHRNLNKLSQVNVTLNQAKTLNEILTKIYKGELK